jgi:hypothetical protein
MTKTDELSNITDKIRKLLALSKSPNPHEAANAAAAARKLLVKHNLSMEDVKGTPKEVGQHLWRQGLKMTQANGALASVAASLNFCKAIYGDDGETWKLVGKPHNAAAAVALLDYLFGALDAAVKENGAGRGLAFQNDFRHGWAVAVCNKMEAMAKPEEAPADERSLVVLEDSAIAEYVAEQGFGKREPPKLQRELSPEAYTLGRMKGEQISLAPQVGEENAADVAPVKTRDFRQTWGVICKECAQTGTESNVIATLRCLVLGSLYPQDVKVLISTLRVGTSAPGYIAEMATDLEQGLEAYLRARDEALVIPLAEHFNRGRVDLPSNLKWLIRDKG